MIKGMVKHVTGTIKKVTGIRPKEFTKKDGSTFKIYSIGILLSDSEWYNVKADSKEKATECIDSDVLKRYFQVGDEVIIYLEAEDLAGMYWRITSIIPVADTAPPMEDIGDDEPVEPAREVISGTEVDPVKAEVTVKDTTDTKDKKDMKTVTNFKTEEADKYEIGMAKNNAAIILASMIHTQSGNNIDNIKKVIAEKLIDYYDVLVKSLYSHGRKIRQEILRY